MKRAWIEFTPEWRSTPLTLWVHGSGRSSATAPAEPWPIPGRGYPQLHVEFDGYTFVFSSWAELDACTAVLGKPLLPSTRTETLRRAQPRGTHWLDHMPDATKPWRWRQRAVRYLQRARRDLQRQLQAALDESACPGLIRQSDDAVDS